MKIRTIAIIAAIPISLTLAAHSITRASDHDDGEIDLKGRSVNLTDFFFFREDTHTGVAGDKGNVVLIMNSNPRSLPTQQYFFSTQARYEFHVSRAGTDKNVSGTANDDVILRFTFGAPDANNVQTFTLTTIIDGTTTVAGTGTTTPYKSNATPTTNALTINGQAASVFAGLREDPFVFDVEWYFTVRNAVAANQAIAAGGIPSGGNDFTKGYNVNSIVVKVPIAALQKSAETVLDGWITVSVPK